MAKLGALYALRESKKVSFVTIDNYRIAATEQLKKYAEIMGIPISAISDQKAFKEHLLDDRSDIVLVDTSGRSHRNEVKLNEIRSFAESIDMEVEKVLCVSATTKRNDLDDVFHAFEVLDYDSVIITKVDETSAIGNVVNVADKYNKPISYITNGQEVPNDIAVATTDGIVELMMGTATTE
jgi:flagellar biosynthesis protein FlhF